VDQVAAATRGSRDFAQSADSHQVSAPALNQYWMAKVNEFKLILTDLEAV